MIPNRFPHTRKILIRSANWVGDAIMTTPAMMAIRNNFPRAHITLLAKPWVMPVFTHNPHVDELMVYEAQGRHQGALGVLRLARDLKERKFDLAILFQNAFEAALIAWLAAIPRRLGFTTDARTLLLTDRIRTWPGLKKGHLVDYYIGLLSSAGFTAGRRKLTLFFTPQEQLAARQALLKLGIAADTRIIGINPGATYGTAKRWPKDRFVELSRRLINDQRACILVFGGPGEAQLGSEIATRVGTGCFNLCNRTRLREAMALIGCCHAFVTNDSGLMHVAAALDIPQVAIIGPTDPRATRPVSQASRLVQNAGSCECAPCLKVDCPLDHRCMTTIDVNMILKRLLEIVPWKDTA
jgi:heptosyltransferase II